MDLSATRNAKLVVGISLLCLLLLPVRTVSAPDWDACVVDTSNRPASGVLVRQSYQNYSAEFSAHDEDLYTNAKGCVHFATKKITSPLLIRLFAILSSATAGVHASFGPYSSVVAFEGAQTRNDVRNGYIYSWTGTSKHESSILTLRE
jgi:hypothetical protein